MPLPDFNDLPETVKPDLLRVLFAQTISEQAPVEIKAQALFELSDKQWHCYERLSPDTAKLVSTWIYTVWNPQSPELIEQSLGIIGRLGLDEAMPLLHRSAQDDSVSPSIRKIIQEAIEEFGPQPLDPYSDTPRKS